MENWELRQRQSLPLEAKIALSKQRIRQWYEAWDGDVYVSFSGGKDSTVLLDLVRNIYPEVPAVFADTGLEYPEIREFVKTFDNVVWLRPKMPFNQVIEEYGYPIISKDVSLHICYARKGSTWAVNAMNGLEKDGSKRGNAFKKRYIKYNYLLKSPFKVSSKCCEIMKELPMKLYGIESKRKPFTGTMADESVRRKQNYLKNGCNLYDSKTPISNPLGIWDEQDVLRYLKQFKITYAKVYGDIFERHGTYYTTGESRTGCMFCMYGVHLDKRENKFQRMAITHPKQYDYCINKLGLGEVLDYIGVDYRRNNLFDVLKV